MGGLRYYLTIKWLNSDMNVPSLSILMCVNRSNPWLLEAIESILNQCDRDFEFLICANDCSDFFWEELQAISDLDMRIKLFRTSIGQLAFNLNFLANIAQGEYLVRMDGDDISEPFRIDILRRSLSLNPVDILGSAVKLIDDKGVVIGEFKFPCDEVAIYKALNSRTAFCHPSVVIRRSFLLGMRGYLGGFSSEDTDLWLRSKRAGAKMQNLPDFLLRYRIHNQQSIASKNGYAEVVSHWMRELLIEFSYYNFRGFLISLVKALLQSYLPGIKKYRYEKKKSVA